MSFRERIRTSLSNPNLQAALDANAERRRQARQAVLAALPDFGERRRRARAVKADVIANLDACLEQFTARVRQNGIVVHRARNAADAVRTVLEIVDGLPHRNSREDAKETFVGAGDEKALIAKSKSMVSEEIDLNHALEAAGHRVVETDLGEYIVQLRGERPSHIITPAVHLRRQDVGALFAEKLGIPYTEDISILTDTARRVLRDVFLGADVGLSGVNFGVVESGTLCLVTNEGNGRMVTTLPPVHIALMGIERLVPTLDDLALFLSLLPRSATGQKLSVYTSLIHAPLPGQTRHLILLDNGRSALRASPLAESLYCIRCGACLNVCPVFRELGGHAYGSIYPGPIGSVISSALVDPSFAYLSQASSLCGACREACPVDIDLPGLLLRVRAGEYPAGTNPAPGAGLPLMVRLGLRAFRFVARTPRLFALFQRLAGLTARLVAPRACFLRLPAWTGWGYSRDFPAPAAKPFRARWETMSRQVADVEISPRAEHEQRQNPVQQSPVGPLAGRFIEELTALGGKVERLAAKDLPARLAEFLKSKGVESALVDAIGAQYLAGGVTAVRKADPSLRVGVTGVLAGIADTGSLLVGASQGLALEASLLPETHVAIVKASQIALTLGDVLTRPEVRQEPAAVVITGPSRTADIEMTLTIGVHGPAELQVFLVDDL